ncbi:hypothetical protein NL676_023794 [Syzygium grande]|nr:hypothetical protein NL676_023794 [Syzygium grande]
MSRAPSLCAATKVEKFHPDATMSDLFFPTELDWGFRFVAAHKVEDASLGLRRLYHVVSRFLFDCTSLADFPPYENGVSSFAKAELNFDNPTVSYGYFCSKFMRLLE